MAPVDKELAEQIKEGVTLDKVDDEDKKRREEEKAKRKAELDKVKEALGAE